VNGWNWLWNSTKDHYFVDGRSLCGRWMVLGNSVSDQPPSDRPCKGCSKKLEARRANNAVDANTANAPVR
jgi:hypothetical protein